MGDDDTAFVVAGGVETADPAVIPALDRFALFGLVLLLAGLACWQMRIRRQ